MSSIYIIPLRENAFKEIKKGSAVPLIADIHFDHRLAIAALDKDPNMLPRITNFVHNEFPLVCDPNRVSQKHFELFGVYIIDKKGVVQTYMPGTSRAQARAPLSEILQELAKVQGVEPPELKGSTETAPTAASA